jgi:hypothetical protein
MGHSGTDWDTVPDFNLTNTQLKAIELTLIGNNDIAIAKALSVSRKTLWRWKTLDDEYRQVLLETRAQNFACATDRYQGLLLQATAILANALKDPDEKNRFRAAQILLNMAGAFRPMLPKYKPKPPPDDNDWPEPVLPEKVG